MHERKWAFVTTNCMILIFFFLQALLGRDLPLFLLLFFDISLSCSLSYTRHSVYYLSCCLSFFSLTIFICLEAYIFWDSLL